MAIVGARSYHICALGVNLRGACECTPPEWDGFPRFMPGQVVTPPVRRPLH